MNNQKIPQKLLELADYMLVNGSTIIGPFVENIAISVGVPVLSNSLLIYKQKKFEKNIEKLIEELKNKYFIMEEMLIQLGRDEEINFLEFSLPCLVDFAIDDNQTEKIQYYSNVIKNRLKRILENQVDNFEIDQKSMQLLLFRTLSELTSYELSVFIEIHNQDASDTHKTESTSKELTGDINLIFKKQALNSLKQKELIINPLILGEMSGNEYLPDIRNIKATRYGNLFYEYIKE